MTIFSCIRVVTPLRRDSTTTRLVSQKLTRFGQLHADWWATHQTLLPRRDTERKTVEPVGSFEVIR